MYKQCELIKNCGDHSKKIVSWIPEEFAVVNRVLKLKNNEVWEDGFVVKTVSETIRETVPDYRKLIRGHRNSTGDSLPKQ